MKYAWYMVCAICVVIAILIIGEQDLRMKEIEMKCTPNTERQRQPLSV